MADTQTTRSPAATERARYIEEADNIFRLLCQGLLKQWQIQYIEEKLDSRGKHRRYMTAKGFVDTIIPFENDRVAKHYGTCSKQHHQLQLLEQEDQGRYWLDKWSDGAEKNAQGCQFFEYFGRSRALYGECESCDEAIECNIRCSRLVAIYKLPPELYWKAVITRKDFPNKYVFEGSHRCNLSCGQDHCMTESHLNLETWAHNARRRSNHSGVRWCFCHNPCIGSEVELDPEGGYADACIKPAAGGQGLTWCY